MIHDVLTARDNLEAIMIALLKQGQTREVDEQRRTKKGDFEREKDDERESSVMAMSSGCRSSSRYKETELEKLPNLSIRLAFSLGTRETTPSSRAASFTIGFTSFTFTLTLCQSACCSSS